MIDPLPDPCVVVLAGASGSGKSTWAHAHYTRSEIVSTDALRAVVGTGPADLRGVHRPSPWPTWSSTPGCAAA